MRTVAWGAVAIGVAAPLVRHRLRLRVPVVTALVLALMRPEGIPTIRILGSFGVGLICLLVLLRVTGNYVRNRPGPGPWDPEA